MILALQYYGHYEDSGITVIQTIGTIEAIPPIRILTQPSHHKKEKVQDEKRI